MTIRELRQQAIQAYRLDVPMDVTDEILTQRIETAHRALAEYAARCRPRLGTLVEYALVRRDWSPSPEWLRDFLAR